MSQAHPSDEQLSAAIDGHDDGAAAHAAQCSSCQVRQDELREVSALLAAPVPVDPAVRDEAVAAAVRAAVGDDFMGRGEIGVEAGRERRRVNWTPIVAVAAVFVLGLLAVPRLISDDGGNDGRGNVTAAQSGDAEWSDEFAGTHLGDFGQVADGEALRGLVAPALGVTAFDAREDSTGGKTQPVPEAAQLRAGAEQPAEQVPVRCSGVARREYGTGLGPLTSTANVRWKEATPDGGSVWTPAVVLAYQLTDPAGERLRHRVFVLADSDCRLLNAVSL